LLKSIAGKFTFTNKAPGCHKVQRTTAVRIQEVKNAQSTLKTVTLGAKILF